MKSYRYTFEVEAGNTDWSMTFEVTTEAGNKRAAEDQVCLLAEKWPKVIAKYIRGSKVPA